MFGRQQYAPINTLINAMTARRRPLIAVHRGTGLGDVPENTVLAAEAALRQGADMVEIDVVESSDGEFFLFHDGMERHAFGADLDLRAMPASAIRKLRYRDVRHDAGLSPLGELLDAVRGREVLLNVDRSWWYWDRLLPFLDSWDMAGQLVFKSPVAFTWLSRLREHAVKYPYVPMVRELSDISVVRRLASVNTVGVELLASAGESDTADKALMPELREAGLLVLLNAINLPDGVPLFAGHDDRTSVFGDVADGWGWLIAHGADIIQTDWPDLLHAYRASLD